MLSKLKSEGFLALRLSKYDLSILYTTMPHNLMNKLNKNFNTEGSFYFACNEKYDFFFTSEQPKYINCGYVRKCEMLSLDNLEYSLAQTYIDKLQAFQLVLIVILLMQICFYLLCETFDVVSF